MSGRKKSLFTEWKFQDFSTNLILREIKVGESGASEIAIFI